jgi:Domain of unknown function DUF29
MNAKVQDEYNKDFYAWALHSAELIREGKFSELDVENLAEELESMGKSERRELISRLAILIAHLLKWQFQPERRCNSWKYTIEEQQLKVTELLEESPSLKYELETKLSDAYKQAVLIAAKETNLDRKVFPEKCFFDLEHCLKPQLNSD